MKNFLYRSLLVGLTFAVAVTSLGSAFVRTAAADEPKPVVVASLAGTDEMLADVLYLTESAGVGDFGRLVALMTSPYTASLDKKRPSGLYVVVKDDGQPAAVGFLPVGDLKMLLKAVEPQVGESQDAGDGVLEIASDRPQPVFIKEVGGWAFLSNSKDNFADLPADPLKLLGGLDQQYTVAVRLNVPAIPAALRETAVREMRRGFEEQLARESDAAKAEAMKQFGGLMVDEMVRLIEQTDAVTLGWQVDASAQKTYLDVQITAVEGSELDQEFATIKESKSAFAGFALPGAALTLNAHGVCSEKEIEQLNLLSKRLREEAMKGLDRDGNLSSDAERAEAKAIVGQLLDVADETLKTGKFDLGAVVSLEPEALTFAIGGFVADGGKLADGVKKLADFGTRKDPNFPGINFDAEEHAGVSFHTASIPLPAGEKERRVLGDPMNVVLGTSKKAAYLSFGKNAGEVLKKVLDVSAEQAKKKLPPTQLSMSLAPVLEFAAATEGDPGVKAAAEAAKPFAGSDHITLTVKPVKHGCVLRLEIEEGVLKAIGGVVKARTNQQ